MKIRMKRSLMLLTAVILLSGGLVAYAATTLFTQTFPGQTFTAPLPFLTEGSCAGSLVLASAISTIPSTSGNVATLIFACNDSTVATLFPAFTTGATPVPVIPAFAVPSGWTLSVDQLTILTCTGGTNEHQLTTGTPVTLAASLNWVYCLTTTSASNFTSFSITWSQ